LGTLEKAMIGGAAWTVEDFRARIRKMTDEQLIRFGRAARYMVNPWNSANRHSVEPVFVVQLRECREEWARIILRKARECFVPPTERL
jgi:hypothetical protein